MQVLAKDLEIGDIVQVGNMEFHVFEKKHDHIKAVRAYIHVADFTVDGKAIYYTGHEEIRYENYHTFDRDNVALIGQYRK